MDHKKELLMGFENAKKGEHTWLKPAMTLFRIKMWLSADEQLVLTLCWKSDRRKAYAHVTRTLGPEPLTAEEFQSEPFREIKQKGIEFCQRSRLVWMGVSEEDQK